MALAMVVIGGEGWHKAVALVASLAAWSKLDNWLNFALALRVAFSFGSSFNVIPDVEVLMAKLGRHH